MNRAIAYLLVITLLTVSMYTSSVFAAEPGPAQAAGDEQTAESGVRDEQAAEPARPALTAAQQQELAQIYQALYANKELLIKKYLEFGVITQEQANHWITRMRERHALIEKHGFLPPMKRDCDKNDNDKNHDNDHNNNHNDKNDRKSDRKNDRKGKH